MDSGHNIFVAKTLSSGFLQIFAISTQCWTTHTILILKFDVALSKVTKIILISVAIVFCDPAPTSFLFFYFLSFHVELNLRGHKSAALSIYP